ncbi:hypothetical protein [Modestobacter excelsi]|uniref:hypothetical protein n=1 Tax=Modestobacter excelsi TaxID=2213161 RepID=UPI00110C906B|nr:hypothetical protein [Modestobacter excelsi]
MPRDPLPIRFLEEEARALLTRLDQVRPFAVHETMVPAAALFPTAQAAIDGLLIEGRRTLHGLVLDYLGWLRGPGLEASPAEQQRRFTLIRLRFNDVLSQFDLFTEVITQRSEHATGVWLSGLDVLAADALSLPRSVLDVPPVVCYLARGPGAAIRRARTRLPGNSANPVAIIRVPRERMIGHGIASSLVHEVGHQAAALLDLVPGIRDDVRRAQRYLPPQARGTWACFDQWASEIVADLWSVARLGISSTLGLMGVVSLPRWFVFRPSGADPHPVPYVRVRLSCAIGEELYPHPQWAATWRLWRALYPLAELPPAHRQSIAGLVAAAPEFVRLLLDHRPSSLHGRSLREELFLPDRRAGPLLARFDEWRRRPGLLPSVPPTLAFAVVGQARAAGRLAPEPESRLLGDLLTQWAVRSSLDVSALCAAAAQGRPQQLYAA